MILKYMNDNWRLAKVRFKMIHVKIDRPIGYTNLTHHVPYPINYGFIPGVIGGDGELQDVYIISNFITQPISVFEGKVIAIIHREDDVEEKWVATTPEEMFTKKQIKDRVNFMEQYFNSNIEMI